MADKKISALTGATTPLAGTEVLPIVQSGATVKVAVSDLTAGRAMAALSLTTATVQATNSGGLALKNSSGTTQLSLGAGGGDNVTLSVATNITPANAAVAISPTGTGTVAISPAGALTVNPTTASTINNTSIGATTALTGRFTDVTLSTGNLVQGTAAKGINFTANTPATGMSSQLLSWYEEGVYTATLTCGTSGTITLSSSYNTLQYTRIGRMVYVSGYITASSVSSPLGSLRLNLPFLSGILTQRASTASSYLQINGATTGGSNAFYINVAGGGNSFGTIALTVGTSAVDAAAQIQGSGNTDITVNFCYPCQ